MTGMGFPSEIGLPQGENHVFFTVTLHLRGRPDQKRASIVSNFVKLTYTEPTTASEGEGAHRVEPLSAQVRRDDFVTIQKQTHEANITFAKRLLRDGQRYHASARRLGLHRRKRHAGSYSSGVLTAAVIG